MQPSKKNNSNFTIYSGEIPLFPFVFSSSSLCLQLLLTDKLWISSKTVLRKSIKFTKKSNTVIDSFFNFWLLNDSKKLFWGYSHLTLRGLIFAGQRQQLTEVKNFWKTIPLTQRLLSFVAAFNLSCKFYSSPFGSTLNSFPFFHTPNSIKPETHWCQLEMLKEAEQTMLISSEQTVQQFLQTFWIVFCQLAN